MSEANDTVLRQVPTMLTLVPNPYAESIQAAVREFVETPKNSLEVLKETYPNAEIFIENGTFYVGIQLELGRHILGYGSTVKKAVDAAIEDIEAMPKNEVVKQNDAA